MTPQKMLDAALAAKDYTQAIRLLSSVKSIQTSANMVSCCKSSDLAFDLLRYVSSAKKIQSIVNLAAENVRYARIIAEDWPEVVNDSILARAIDGDLGWAEKFKTKYSLTPTKLKGLLKYKKSESKATPHAGSPLITNAEI